MHSQNLYLIDAIGPFFIDYKKQTINWSNVQYENLEKDNRLNQRKTDEITSLYTKFLDTAIRNSYNGIILDDVAHAVIHPFYPDALQKKLEAYSRLYKKLFANAHKKKLKVFLRIDVMYSNDVIRKHVKNTTEEKINFLYKTLELLFTQYSQVDGVIFRIGESDGMDVTGDFLSSLTIKTPIEANRLLQRILPLFERHDKQLIFRTWTLGAYPIGDLMWNEQTYDAVFDGITSDKLIISMKYSDCDFFKYATLTPFFFRNPLKKLLELQTRREYEGFGKFPYYPGWQYEEYSKQLLSSPTFCGISVWCQSGGWGHERNITWVKDSSFWVELATSAATALFKNNMSADDAARAYYQQTFGHKAKQTEEHFLKFLRLADTVIAEGLYIKEFAQKTLYFRRVRLPLICHSTWDNVTINPIIALLHKLFVTNPTMAIHESERSIDNLLQMKALAKKIALPYTAFDNQFALFQILVQCRKLLLGKYDQTTIATLQKDILAYTKAFPHANTITVRLREPQRQDKIISSILKRCIRTHKEYRSFDSYLLRNHVSQISQLTVRIISNYLPGFINKQAMNITTFLK